jgi:hypothetical protein
MKPLQITPKRYRRILAGACVLALVALGLMVWSLLEPTPMPVIVAMSVAQGLGTLSLLAFLGVVIADARRARWEPPSDTSSPPS